ncbi:MAG: hypothetical protein V3T05_08755, partial [Myxococcota bacterium]
MALAAGQMACEESLRIEAADVTMLKIKVDDLERRLTKLEGRVASMTPPALTVPTDVPDWVARGSGVSAEDPNIIIGVGSATGVMNEAMARSNAEAAAKEEIAKLIRTTFETTRKGRGSVPISAVALAGIRMREHYMHPDGRHHQRRGRDPRRRGALGAGGTAGLGRLCLPRRGGPRHRC